MRGCSGNHDSSPLLLRCDAEGPFNVVVVKWMDMVVCCRLVERPRQPLLECSSWVIHMPDVPITWMRTRELAAYLGIHRNTLGNMLRSGLLREGVHRRKINPLAPRGEFLWNQEAVLITLGVL